MSKIYLKPRFQEIFSQTSGTYILFSCGYCFSSCCFEHCTDLLFLDYCSFTATKKTWHVQILSYMLHTSGSDVTKALHEKTYPNQPTCAAEKAFFACHEDQWAYALNSLRVCCTQTEEGKKQRMTKEWWQILLQLHELSDWKNRWHWWQRQILNISFSTKLLSRAFSICEKTQENLNL